MEEKIHREGIAEAMRVTAVYLGEFKDAVGGSLPARARALQRAYARPEEVLRMTLSVAWRRSTSQTKGGSGTKTGTRVLCCM